MKYDHPIAVIGAGPYGLSIAAHLKARGLPTLVFGKTMEFWQRMPAELCLKSVWTASSLCDPDDSYTIGRYYASRNMPEGEPIPLANFLAYGEWFQKQTVPDVDPTYVKTLARDGSAFRLEMEDGRSLKASSVIVASGIAGFEYLPNFARMLPKALATHTQDYGDLKRFKGQRLVVIGSGQSALEYAAIAHEAGAEVEIIARNRILWVNRALYEKTGPFRHIFYPPSDVGPPGINWLIALPALFSRMPDQFRQVIDQRAVRPAGAQWLRRRVEGHIRMTPNTGVVRAEERGGKLHLELSDGSTREVDHMLLGTGYRPDVAKIPYMDRALCQEVQVQNGRPILSKWFESSVPQLYFAGALAGHTFGPICRFVAGARIPAKYITQQVARVA